MKVWHLELTQYQMDVLAVSLGAAKALFREFPHFGERLDKPVVEKDIDVLHLDIKRQMERQEGNFALNSVTLEK